MILFLKGSVAIMAEISENARNLKLIADGNFRTIGHEIMAKNARNFTFSQKEPEIARNLVKAGLTWAKFNVFLIHKFSIFFTFLI